MSPSVLIADLLPCRWRSFLTLLFFCLLCAPQQTLASTPNHLQRLDVRNKQKFTRISLSLAAEPQYNLVKLPNNRLRLYLYNTDGSRFKSLRRYSDANIGGIVLSQQGADLVMTFAVPAKGVGWRLVHMAGLPALSLDVGPLFEPKPLKPSLPGRDRIWSGAEKLLRDFDPPIKPEIPFVPTDRQVLKPLLDESEQKLFLAAEGALYKGRITAAEDAFTQFAARKGSAIRPLALYRLAEAQYRLQRYPQALASFREAEQLWTDFLSFNPASMFYYGDSIVRSGDVPGGRQLLSRLIVAHADRKYAPVLLVRMADALARKGSESVAEAIYKTVSGAFKDNKANQIARMKLADSKLLLATPLDYKPLLAIYRDIAARAGDVDLREEASFKAMLLEAINGSAKEALSEVIRYQKHFPKGVYTSIVRDIREDLVEQSYRQGSWDKEPTALLALLNQNKEYLAGALRVPGFLPAVTAAYEKAGHPIDLIALYAGLLDRPWVGDANAPYLYLQVAEQSEMLGDTVLAKKILRSYLMRYPGDQYNRQAYERLGAMGYNDGDTNETRNNLLWILNKNEQARFPVSYYYLGKALSQSKDYVRAALAMELYVKSLKTTGGTSPLVGDAYYVAALAHQSLGQRKEALALLDAGSKVAPADISDQFLYKLGEIYLQDGKPSEARSYFEKLSKNTKDADWRRLATQALLSIGSSPPTPSKNPKVK